MCDPTSIARFRIIRRLAKAARGRVQGAHRDRNKFERCESTRGLGSSRTRPGRTTSFTRARSTAKGSRIYARATASNSTSARAEGPSRRERPAHVHLGLSREGEAASGYDEGVGTARSNIGARWNGHPADAPSRRIRNPGERQAVDVEPASRVRGSLGDPGLHEGAAADTASRPRRRAGNGLHIARRAGCLPPCRRGRGRAPAGGHRMESRTARRPHRLSAPRPAGADPVGGCRIHAARKPVNASTRSSWTWTTVRPRLRSTSMPDSTTTAALPLRMRHCVREELWPIWSAWEDTKFEQRLRFHRFDGRSSAGARPAEEGRAAAHYLSGAQGWSLP